MNRALIAIAGILVAGLVNAQDAPKAKPPSAEDARRQEMLRQAMQGPAGAAAPTVAQVTDAMIESQLRAAENPETARRLAVFKKNLYDALQAQGFGKQDALSIVLATPPPSGLPGAR